MGVDFVLSNFVRLVESKKKLVEDALKFNTTRGTAHTYYTQLSSLLDLEREELQRTEGGPEVFTQLEEYLHDLARRLPPVSPMVSPRKLARNAQDWVEPTLPRRAIRVYLSSNSVDFEAERLALQETVWPALADICAQRGVFFTAVDLQSGLTEYEASPDDLEIALNEIELSRPHFISLVSGERYGWIPEDEGLPPHALQAMPWLEEASGKSWPEIEAMHGVLNAVDQDENAPVSAFFYIRSKEFVNEVPARLRYLYQSEGPDTDEKLQAFISHINDSGCPVRHHYPSVRMLCERVLEDLAQAISHDHPLLDEESEQLLPLDTARLHGDICRRTISAVHIPHEDVERTFTEHCRGRIQEPLVVLGEEGSGKTSNMARFRQQLLAETAQCTYAQDDAAFVFYHSAWGVRDSKDRTLMLRRFMQQVKEHYRLPHEVPTDDTEVLTTFYSWLELAAQSAQNAGSRLPAVFMVDGLDDMDQGDDDSKLLWLPSKFPHGIICVVSCTTINGETNAITNTLLDRQCPRIDIPYMSKALQTRCVQAYAERNGRTLTRRQVESFVQSEKTTNARYLNTLLLEFTTVRDMIEQEQIEFTTSRLRARNCVEMYQQVFKRVEEFIDEQEGDKALLGDTLALLYCSRFGLAEQELLSILSCTQRAWAFLMYHIGHILIRAGALLVLECQDLREAVRLSYITSPERKRDLHLRLAQYFGGQPALRYRSVEEYPHQLYESGQLEVLKAAITDIGMFLNLHTAQQRSELARYWRAVVERYDKRVCIPTARALRNSLSEYRPVQMSYSPLLDAQNAQPNTNRANDTSRVSSGAYLSTSHRGDAGLLSRRKPFEHRQKPKAVTTRMWETARNPVKRPASAYSVPRTPRPPTAPSRGSQFSRGAAAYNEWTNGNVDSCVGSSTPAARPPTGIPLLDLTSLNATVGTTTLRRLDDDYLTHRPTGMVTQQLSDLAVEAAVASVNAAISLAEFFEYVGAFKDAEAVYNLALSFTQAHKRAQDGSDGEEEEEEEEEDEGDDGTLKKRKRQPDEADHFSYLEVLRKIASLYAKRGRTRKAAAAYQRLIDAAKGFPGVVDDRRAAEVQGRHEFEYAQLVGQKLGKWKLARPMLEQSAKLRSRVLGEDDITVAETREALADACMHLGDYHAAEVALRAALDHRLQRQGPFHPGVRDARRALARAYEAQYKWDEAEELYTASLSVAKTQFGIQHPDYAHAQNGLGLTGSRRGHLKQALDRLQDALEIRTRHFGEDSVLVAECRSNIAWLLLQQKQYQEAESLAVQAATVQLQELGATDLAYIASINQLIDIHMNTKDYDRVQTEFEALLAKLDAKLSRDHPSVIKLLRQFGKFALDDGRYEIALTHYESLLDITEKQISYVQDGGSGQTGASDGEDDDSDKDGDGDDADDQGAELEEEMSDHEREALTATLTARLIETVSSLGAVHRECARYDQALEQFNRLLELHTEKDGEDSTEVIAVVDRIADTLYAKGALVEAEAEREKCVQYWSTRASNQFERLREKRAADAAAAAAAAAEAKRREELGSDYDEEEEEEEDDDDDRRKDDGGSDDDDDDDDADAESDTGSDKGSAVGEGGDDADAKSATGEADEEEGEPAEPPRSPTPPPPPIEITSVTEADRQYLRALYNKAYTHGAMGLLRTATAEFQELQAFYELAFGPNTLYAAEIIADQAWIALEYGEFDDAWEMLEKAKTILKQQQYPTDGPISLKIEGHCLLAMVQMRKHEEARPLAEEYLRRVISVRTKKNVVAHRCAQARAATILGGILTETGQWDEGEDQYTTALFLREHVNKDRPTEEELAALEEAKEEAKEERRRARRRAAGKASDGEEDSGDEFEDHEDEAEEEQAEPEEPSTHYTIGEVLCDAATLIMDDEKKLDESQELLQRALDLQTAALGGIEPEPVPEDEEAPESDEHRLIQRTNELLEDVAKRKEKYERKKARRRRKVSPKKKPKK